MATLELKDIRKRYKNAPEDVLKGINISIDSGEFLILVGPSGCGKSTLMNTIAGLEDISQGEIRIDGENVVNVQPKDRDIAMVFQSYALYPNMTVRENISFGLKIKKYPADKIATEIKRVSEMLQIEPLLDRKPSQLSGGQQQRVSMGRALARRPRMYLFDEPLSNLDAKLRVEMRTEIKKLHQRLNTTIVYVTHDQIEAMTLADRIAVMQDGSLLQLGTPHEIYNQPNNMFVAGFIGSPPMNFIRSEVSLDSAGKPIMHLKCKHEDAHTLRLPAFMSFYKGQRVVLGLRPEHISMAEESACPETGAQLTLEVEVLEPTGPDTIAVVHLHDIDMSCRLHPDHEIRVGQKITLNIDLSRAVFFDHETQQRIVP